MRPVVRRAITSSYGHLFANTGTAGIIGGHVNCSIAAFVSMRRSYATFPAKDTPDAAIAMEDIPEEVFLEALDNSANPEAVVRMAPSERLHFVHMRIFQLFMFLGRHLNMKDKARAEKLRKEFLENDVDEPSTVAWSRAAVVRSVAAVVKILSSIPSSSSLRQEYKEVFDIFGALLPLHDIYIADGKVPARPEWTEFWEKAEPLVLLIGLKLDDAGFATSKLETSSSGVGENKDDRTHEGNVLEGKTDREGTRSPTKESALITLHSASIRQPWMDKLSDEERLRFAFRQTTRIFYPFTVSESEDEAVQSLEEFWKADAEASSVVGLTRAAVVHVTQLMLEVVSSIPSDSALRAEQEDIFLLVKTISDLTDSFAPDSDLAAQPRWKDFWGKAQSQLLSLAVKLDKEGFNNPLTEDTS